MRHQQGVLVLEAVEILQDGRAVVVKAVVAPPLQIADLHGDLRQLEGVGIDFDGLELLHAHLRLEGEAKLRGEGDDFLFQVQQQLQRDVKEVAAAAGGVQHGDGGKFFQEFRRAVSRCARSAFAAFERTRRQSSALSAAHSRRSGAMSTGSTSVLMSASLV